MLKIALVEAMWPNSKIHSALANQRFVKAGLAGFRHAIDFQRMFPDAEHKIVQSEHDFGPPDYWRTVHNWLSRTRLYNRYVVMLSVAIDIAKGGAIDQLKPPELHLFEIKRVTKGKREKDGPKYQLGWAQFDAKEWRRLVKSSGDVDALEIELNTKPVRRFEIYWRDTKPGWITCSGLRVTAPSNKRLHDNPVRPRAAKRRRSSSRRGHS